MFGGPPDPRQVVGGAFIYVTEAVRCAPYNTDSWLRPVAIFYGAIL
jgi:hypothetical protein